MVAVVAVFLGDEAASMEVWSAIARSEDARISDEWMMVEGPNSVPFRELFQEQTASKTAALRLRPCKQQCF